MLARCAHPTATFVAAPTNTHTSFTIFTGTQNDESRQRRHSLRPVIRSVVIKRWSEKCDWQEWRD